MAAQDYRVDPNDLIPRYYQVYTSLLERIQSGEFPPGGLIPNERLLVEEYGVSRITVIRALQLLEGDGYIDRQQGRGTFVTIPAGRAAAAADTYPPSRVAFLATSLTHPYMSSMLVGIAGVSAQRGYLLHVLGSIANSQQEAACIREAIAADIRGLLTYAYGEYQNVALYREAQARGIALVFVDRYYPEIAADYVVFDDRQAAYDLCTALIRQGHRRIAFVLSEEQRATSVHDRLAGYRQALEAAGVAYDEELVWADIVQTYTPAENRRPQAATTTAVLLEHLHIEQPTALITVNYDVAERLIYALHTTNVRGQELEQGEIQLAIGSFCHVYPAHNTPFVSVLAMQPGEALGAAAAELLLSRLEGTAPAGPQHVRLPMKIVEFVPDMALTSVT